MTRPFGFALLAAVAWLYGSTAVVLSRDWLSNSDASYGAVLAAVALLLAWRRRDVFAAAASGGAAAGLTVFLFGLTIYLVGMFGADVFLTRISIVPVLAGAAVFLAGWRAARVIVAPLAFLLLAIPPPTLLVNAVTLPLQLVASQVAESSLMAAGVPVFRDGNVLHLPSATLEVAEACSGLRSLVSLGALSVLLAWATEQKLLPRVAIVAASLPIAVFSNGLRVAFTGAATQVWGPAVANGSWHTFTGWLTFVGALGLLMLLRRVMHAAIAPGRLQTRTVPA